MFLNSQTQNWILSSMYVQNRNQDTVVIYFSKLEPEVLHKSKEPLNTGFQFPDEEARVMSIPREILTRYTTLFQGTLITVVSRHKFGNTLQNPKFIKKKIKKKKKQPIFCVFQANFFYKKIYNRMNIFRKLCYLLTIFSPKRTDWFKPGTVELTCHSNTG